MDNENENGIENRNVTVTTVGPEKILKVKKSQIKFNISEFDHEWKKTPEFLEAFTRFNEMRISTGHAMTVNAAEMIMTELVKLSKGDIATAILILNKSTRSSWRDVFPLKLSEQIQSNGSTNKTTDAYSQAAEKLKQS